MRSIHLSQCTSADGCGFFGVAAQQKKEEQAAKAAEAAAKKLEGKKLAAAEDAELATVGKKKAASAAEKVGRREAGVGRHYKSIYYIKRARLLVEASAGLIKYQERWQG